MHNLAHGSASMGNVSSLLVAHQELLNTFSSATSVNVGDPFWRGLLNFGAPLTKLDPVVLQQSLADTLDQLGVQSEQQQKGCVAQILLTPAGTWHPTIPCILQLCNPV